MGIFCPIPSPQGARPSPSDPHHVDARGGRGILAPPLPCQLTHPHYANVSGNLSPTGMYLIIRIGDYSVKTMGGTVLGQYPWAWTEVGHKSVGTTFRTPLGVQGVLHFLTRPCRMI